MGVRRVYLRGGGSLFANAFSSSSRRRFVKLDPSSFLGGWLIVRRSYIHTLETFWLPSNVSFVKEGPQEASFPFS